MGGVCAEIGCLAAEQWLRASEGAGAPHRPARHPDAGRLHARAVLLSRRRAHRAIRELRASAASHEALQMFYDLASTTWGDEEHQRDSAGDRERPAHDGRARAARSRRPSPRKFGVKHAVMVSSGSSANLVGVAALFYKRERPLQRGDEVIVPAISWATTYYPLQQYGLQAAVRRRRARHAEHRRLAARRGADAAHADGRRRQHPRQSGALDVMRALLRSRTACICSRTTASRWAPPSNGKPCGTFGDINTFSTFFSHHISTMEGGWS